MAFTEPLEHDAVSSQKRNSLTLGSEPSYLRVRNRERCTVMTQALRSDVFTEHNEVFVTTTTDSISV